MYIYVENLNGFVDSFWIPSGLIKCLHTYIINKIYHMIDMIEYCTAGTESQHATPIDWSCILEKLDKNR